MPGGTICWWTRSLRALASVATLLVGTGKSKVMHASAGVEGSAGIGAEAKFAAGLNEGMIEVSGKVGGTFGLGGGVKTKIGLNAVDGVRLVGVLGMKGMNWLSEAIPEAVAWMIRSSTKSSSDRQLP